MKTIFFFHFLFCSFVLIAQENKDTLHFKEQKMSEKGKILFTVDYPITPDQPIDIYFYNKHFKRPTQFPQQLVQTEFNDTTVVEWYQENEPKSLQSNYYFETTYDEKGKAIRYYFSGCAACTSFSFTLKIEYDEQNRPTRLKKWLGNLEAIPKGDKETIPVIEETILFYDQTGNLIHLKQYIEDHLIWEIGIE